MSSIDVSDGSRAKSALRALLVTSSDSFERRVAEALGRAYSVAHGIARDGEELRAALEGGSWDVIVCECASARMVPGDAAHILHEGRTEAPLIVVAADESEEAAAAAFEVGARDVLGLGELDRLARVVQRVLRESTLAGRWRVNGPFGALLEASPDALLVVDADGRIAHVNRHVEEIFGYAPADLLGKPVELLVPVAQRARHEEHRRHYSAHPSVRPMGIDMELRGRRMDGTEIPVEISLSPLPAGKGTICAVRDVTERKRADRMLRQITEGTAAAAGTEFMHTLVRNLAAALEVRYAFVGELRGPDRARVRVISFWNGLEHAEPFEYALEGTPCRVAIERAEYFYAQGVQDQFPRDDALVRFGVDCYLGVRLRSSRGETLGLLAIMHTRPIRHQATAESVMRIFAARAGVELERQQVLEALERSQKRFVKAFATNPLGVVITRRADGKILDVNEALCDLLGYASQELVGRTTVEAAYWADSSARERAIAMLNAGGNVRGWEHEIRRKSGEIRVVQDWVEPIELDGEPCLLGSMLDVTERKRSESIISRLGRALEKSSNEIYMFDAQTLKFIQVNQGACENLGYTADEMRGMTPLDIKPEYDLERFRRLIAPLETGEASTLFFATSHRRKDGSLYPVEVRLQLSADGRPPVFVAVIQDITERKRAEQALRESETRFRDLTELSSDWYWELDENFRFIESPGIARATNGVRAKDYVGKTRWELHAERLTPEQWAAHRRQLEARETFHDLEYERLSADGKLRWVSVSGRPIYDAEGRFRGYRGVGRDITEQKRVDAALRLRDRAMESSVNAIMITDATRPENPVIYVNPAFERTTGYSAAEALGRNPRFLHGTDTQQPAIETLRAALREQREAGVLLRNYRKDGTLFWNELRVAPVRDAAGRVTHFVGVQNDVTERVRYQAELEHQAKFDFLTGLANRSLLNDRLQRAIARAQRTGRLGAVLFLDLDRFKRINDSLGHVMGDRLLAEIGARLTRCVRSDDTVARTGGDEFVILLSDVAREDDVALVAQKLLGAVSSPLRLEGREFLVSTSIGISVFPKDGADAETLLKHADVALYRAKEAGRGRFAFFAMEMNERAVRYFDLENGLRGALERGEFLLHYQPIISLAGGAVTGAEALLRWRQPSGQIVSPADFIPVAEESGLIVPIGAWVLMTAAAQAAAWNGKGGTPLDVSVNVSARQFRDPGLVGVVREVLEITRLDPRRLKLEITESTVMHNAEEAVAVLRALKELGVHLSVDDFGTGYSSLSYLKRLPIDDLKIDRSFVRDIPGDADDVAITRAVIDLAHSMELEVVAEGVETAAQERFLRGEGCDRAQGYLFGRPVDADSFAKLLKKRSAARAPKRPRRKPRR